MSALEKVDWERLDGELYSVIAHASAGTDFCSPDLQMAVDGCIEEVKRALKAAEEKFTSTNTPSMPCQAMNVHRVLLLAGVEKCPVCRKLLG